MKELILLAAAAVLASTGPALAKPGKGKAHGHAGHGHVLVAPGSPLGYGAGGCPPGLAKKAIPCVPPGQAKKQFALGQRVPFGYNGLLGYNALPYNLRNHYGPQLDPRSRYIYDNSYIYRVDPRTLVVQQILSAILRR